MYNTYITDTSSLCTSTSFTAPTTQACGCEIETARPPGLDEADLSTISIITDIGVHSILVDELDVYGRAEASAQTEPSCTDIRPEDNFEVYTGGSHGDISFAHKPSSPSECLTLRAGGDEFDPRQSKDVMTENTAAQTDCIPTKSRHSQCRNRIDEVASGGTQIITDVCDQSSQAVAHACASMTQTEIVPKHSSGAQTDFDIKAFEMQAKGGTSSIEEAHRRSTCTIDCRTGARHNV